MLKLARLLCAWGWVALAGLAQQSPPDPAAVMESLGKQMAPMAIAWLHSADPRVQAWGAYAVLRDRQTDAIPVLLAMLAGFQVVEQVTTQADADQHGVMLGVLDALIEFEAQVPVVDAVRIYPEFPAQSLILLSRSQDDAVPQLMTIFKNEQRWQSAWLAAGNLLLQKHAEGFAAAVVEGMKVHAQVIVTASNSGGGFGGSSMCCGLGGQAAPKLGWPPLGVYVFGGCGDRVLPGDKVLAAGADPAYYDRKVGTNYQIRALGFSCCPLDQDLVRQHYLTTLLFGSAERPPIRAHVSHSIQWQGPDAYLAEFSAFIDQQQGGFADLARQLSEWKLISETEAKTLRPKLQIRILDLRGAQPPSLPEIAAFNGNVTIESF